MKFRFAKRSKAKNSFRVASIMGKYDLNALDIVERFEGDIPIDLTSNNWNIGVIHGTSGTGKTQIIKHLFSKYIYDFRNHDESCILEDFDKKLSNEKITKLLCDVGFTTAKSWLKPYSVLSNGEKMRVNLALALSGGNDLCVFDEFTSVVDRRVAKVGSYSVQKSVRKMKKKFIAVSCHDDILDWLEPDWTFCTDSMKFTLTRGKLRRPKIEIKIVECKGYWSLFKKYHYMNQNLLASASEFVAFHEEKPIAFFAMTHLVHNKVKDGVRLHRVVVMPDYQGIGIGTKLVNLISDKFRQEGKRVFARLSHPAMIAILDKSENWLLTNNIGRTVKHKGNLASALCDSRLVASWEYKKYLTKENL